MAFVFIPLIALAMNKKTSQNPEDLPSNNTLVTGFSLHLQQFTALSKKNLLIKARAWKTNLLLVFQAALFIFLIWAVNQAVTASRQRMPAFSSLTSSSDPTTITSIPLCDTNIYMRQDQPCLTLAYAPSGIPLVQQIINGIATHNSPAIPPTSILGFPDPADIDPYLLSHPQTVLASVTFAFTDPNNPADISFSLQTNSSVQWFKGQWQDPNTYIQLPLQVAVEREIARIMTGGNVQLSWNVEVAEFPHPAATSPSMVGTFAPTFIFASIMFQFVLLLHDVVEEKEKGVRRAMITMGLRGAPYWTSWILFQAVLAVIQTCLLIGFGYAFQFALFTQNAFSLSFLLIFLVNLAMMSFGFFVASLVNKASSAIPVGFFLFIVAWVFLIVVAFGFPFSTKYGPGAVLLFSTMPWTLLGKGISDLGYATSEGDGLTWEERYSYCQAETPSPAEQEDLGYWYDKCLMSLGDIYIALAIQIVMYLILAVLIDMDKSSWMHVFQNRKKKAKKAAADALRVLQQREEEEEGGRGGGDDEDVAEHSRMMKKLCIKYLREEDKEEERQQEDEDEMSRKIVVRLYGLRKVFKRRTGLFSWLSSLLPSFRRTTAATTITTSTTAATKRRINNNSNKNEFVAVRGSWLGIETDSCLCLLGPNGAGKSTTINCLTGVSPPTSGDAIVCGRSIVSSIDKIRPLMGVCPQFDVLWEELTGREHLILFAAIKGLPPPTHQAEAAKLLEEVKLTEAATVRAGSYSGGMKRRLSVAMAFCGNPAVVYLDEPTTGLDPISRRHLWELIEKQKKSGRAIVLTTHSMEEADMLGDRIAIMARGRVRCIGTGLRLKSRFGSGYRVSIRVTGDDGLSTTTTANGITRQEVKDLFSSRLGIMPADETKGFVHFLVPPEQEDALPMTIAGLPNDAVQLRQAPLEEVFLTVTKRAELEAAEQEGRKEVVVLDEGVVVEVPVGADFIQAPNGDMYHVRWAQDENGALKVLDFWKD
jgi:ABC-type multidrug transport system ATPase subunit